MNFLKRALLAVSRRKGKTIILFVILAAIANLVLTGFAIQHATKAAGILARQKLGGEITLSYNTQAAMERSREEMQRNAGGLGGIGRLRAVFLPEPVTVEMAEMVSKLENILDYNYIVNTNGIAENFEPVVMEDDTEDNTENDNSDTGTPMWQNGRQQPIINVFGGGDLIIPDVTVNGVRSTELTDDFNEGNVIIEGQPIRPEDAGRQVAVIEKNLAELNGLKLGDKIKIKGVRSEDIIELEIIGIYQANTANSPLGGLRMGGMPFIEPFNMIYTDYQSALKLKNAAGNNGGTTAGLDTAIFYIDDPVNIEKALKEAKTLDIDWDKYTLDANNQAYENMMGPIENVASFSMIVVYIVAAAGAAILALILMLAVKERIYETGVLLSMGEGKLKIILQYVTEVLVIAILAFGLSAVSGKYISQEVGNMLLNREIKLVEEQRMNNRPGMPAMFQGGAFAGGNRFGRLMESRFGQGGNSGFSPIESIDVKVTLAEVGQTAGAGLIIILLATMIPAMTIMRFKPKSILTRAT